MNNKYYKEMIDRLFRVLVWYEKFPEEFDDYLFNLKIEISGNEDFTEMRRVYYLLNTLSLYQPTHNNVKKIVFDCIGIVNEIIKNWKE